LTPQRVSLGASGAFSRQAAIPAHNVSNRVLCDVKSSIK
jgi:hypothetical protein